MSKLELHIGQINSLKDGKRFHLSTTKVEQTHKKESDMKKILLLLLIPLFLIGCKYEDKIEASMEWHVVVLIVLWAVVLYFLPRVIKETFKNVFKEVEEDGQE